MHIHLLESLMYFTETEKVLDLGRGCYKTFTGSYLSGNYLACDLIRTAFHLTFTIGWIVTEAEKDTPLDEIVVRHYPQGPSCERGAG